MISASAEAHTYDALFGEHNILRKKLESKTEALLILSNELQECRTERDQLRSLVEQMKSGRYVKNRQSIDNKILTQNLSECKEKNKILQIEIKNIKQKLQESEGDMKVLREQISRQRQGSSSGGETDETVAATAAATASSQTRHFSAHERDCLVASLESIKMKYGLLERDLQSVLDEKEELITARDAYKHKMNRLNHELHHALKGDDKKIIDIDALLMENRYLQERLKQTQEEKSLYMQTLSKYKSILEKRRNKSALKLGSNAGESGSLIVTHKQVEQMLQDASVARLPATDATIADLRSLALALFESLNDKNIALAHQKKTNKILGQRLTELEKKLSTSEFSSWMPKEGEEDTIDGSHNSSPQHTQHFLEDDDVCGFAIRNGSEPISVKSVPNNDTSAMSTDHNVDQHLESLVKSRSSCINLNNAAESSTKLQSTSLRQNVSNSEEDLPPKLKKLVEDAMEDLDRRLTKTTLDKDGRE